MDSSRRPRQSGITLVESAAVLGIVSILIGSAVPSLLQLRASQQLISAAAELRTDLQFARNTAVAFGQPVRLRVQSSPAGSCYVMHTGSAAACTCSPTAGANCNAAGQVVRSAQFGANHPVAISANSNSMAFDGRLGTVTPTGTLTLDHRNGGQLRVVINIMGRARTCQSAGARMGFEAC